LGKRDKQTGRLTFANRHNVPFDWDEEYKQRPLIDDNAPEPEPASLPFPDIPAEMPGILYESEMPDTTLLPKDLPPIEPDPDDLAAHEAAAALDNANLGHCEAALLRRAEIAGVNCDEPQHLQPFYNITNNNINVVRAEDDKFDQAGDDKDEDDGAAPDLLQPGEDDYPNSSDDEGDDEDYEDNESSDDNNDDSYGVEMVPEDEALEDEPHGNRRSGREHRAPNKLQSNRLREWNMMNAATLLNATGVKILSLCRRMRQHTLVSCYCK
jgi:hypothetical protein